MGPVPPPTLEDVCRPAAINCWSLTNGTISFDDGGGGDTASSLSCTNGVSIGSCDESKNKNVLSYQYFAKYIKI